MTPALAAGIKTERRRGSKTSKLIAPPENFSALSRVRTGLRKHKKGVAMVQEEDELGDDPLEVEDLEE